MESEDLDTPEVKNGNYQRKSIPLWFIVVSIIVLGWAIYYIYAFWGGLGPGIPQRG